MNSELDSYYIYIYIFLKHYFQTGGGSSKRSSIDQKTNKLTSLQAATLQNSKNELNNLMESKFFSCVELVIERTSGKLVEKNRIPGENDIGKLNKKKTIIPAKKISLFNTI